MIRINQIKMPLHHNAAALEQKIRKRLGLSGDQELRYRIIRKSIDARKKPELSLVYSVEVSTSGEEKIIKRANDPNVTIVKQTGYHLPGAVSPTPSIPPVIVGAGPAGLFCAYALTMSGCAPVVLERGRSVTERTKDVERFWESGVLDTVSNVQFGEGGAGTFSDGKLNTLVKDPTGRNRFVLETFVKFGAPEQILYENKPHIGTDILAGVIKNMRQAMEARGARFCFESCMTDYRREADGKMFVEVNHKEWIETSRLVLAIGHSARDTFGMLYQKQDFVMEAKAFAVGFRVEHPQEMMNLQQYGALHAHELPAAPYKVTANLANGRGVYSFCMCPGGYVVNASSEEGRLAVNGMSYHARDSRNANSAIVVTVTPEDFESDHPLAGIAFQRKLEKAAYKAGKGKIPVQRYGDFYRSVTGKEKEKTEAEVWYQGHEPCMKGAYEETDLAGIFPAKISSALVDGMENFNKKIRGFSHPLSILSGVESRTSSPVRIVRDNHSLESVIGGLYPCGEGAGYAGGITSAAADGIKIAEKIRQKYAPFL